MVKLATVALVWEVELPPHADSAARANSAAVANIVRRGPRAPDTRSALGLSTGPILAGQPGDRGRLFTAATSALAARMRRRQCAAVGPSEQAIERGQELTHNRRHAHGLRARF